MAKNISKILDGVRRCTEPTYQCVGCPYEAEALCYKNLQSDVIAYLSIFKKKEKPSLEEQPMLPGIDISYVS